MIARINYKKCICFLFYQELFKRMLLPQFHPNCLNNALLPLLHNVVNGVHISPSSVPRICYYFGSNNLSPSLAVLRSLLKTYSVGTMDSHVNVKDASVESLDIESNEHLKEKQRRMRIGLANKGKVPWNRGRKHSAETLERIKHKTIEALRDPKIRRKLSGHAQAHSEESKRKISSSLKCSWSKRLKIKQSKEMFLQSWRLRMAIAAKKGGNGQDELEWDSYITSLDIKSFKLLKEKQRRMRIGLANKGKVPWNKGRKHSAETRERIKQKTTEALRDPEVRRKLSNYHHQPHSEESKAKISSALKRSWRKRLKIKRSKEISFQSWRRRIANAAQKGGIGQEELEWNSCNCKGRKHSAGKTHQPQ